MPVAQTEPERPSVVDVLSGAIRDLPPHTRRAIGYVLIATVAVLLLQTWDSRNSAGMRGVAEWFSVILGTTGILVFSLGQVLRAAAEPPAGPPRTLGDLGWSPVDPALPAVRKILMALPLVGAISAALLAAAITFLVARVWLGTSVVVLVIAVFYAIAIVAALAVVTDSAKRLFAHAQEQTARIARMEAQLGEARLAALQAQMNPHFLFNALNTVAALAGTDPRAAETTVENLSEVLRTTLEQSQRPLCRVADEVSFVRAYQAVGRQRFGPRLSVEFDIDPDLEGAIIPPFSLQPLVENALKHGIGPRGAGRLRISARRLGERLCLTVEDDGEGFDPRHKEGTGLGNLRAK